MKRNREQAERWLKQAIHDFKVAQKHSADLFSSDACFMAEQTAQKALKAFLYFSGERFIHFHSVTKLVSICTQKESSFLKWVDQAKLLDKYYIPTRYPDALPEPAVPYEEFTQNEAKEAVESARQILEQVKNKIIKSQD